MVFLCGMLVFVDMDYATRGEVGVQLVGLVRVLTYNVVYRYISVYWHE